MKLGLQAYCGYFLGMWKMVPVAQIFRPFLAPNRTKIGQYIGFRLFSAGFTWNLIYKLIGATLVAVQKIGPRDPNFWASKWVKTQVFLLKSFLWIHINLALYAHWIYFQRCVHYGPQRPNIWAILGPKVSQNFGLVTFSKKFLLVSHEYCFTCSLQVLLDVLRIWASWAQFWDHFGSQYQ